MDKENDTVHEDFFTDEEAGQIIDAIQQVESRSTGEIRVHLEDYCPIEIKQRSREVFEELKMHETQNRNGVLIYLAVGDRKFSVFADEKVTLKIEASFWEKIIQQMSIDFSKGQSLQGMLYAIQEIGKALHYHYPPITSSDASNELPDTLSFGSDLGKE